MPEIAGRLGGTWAGGAEAQVWHAWVDGDRDEGVLSPPERARLARFTLPSAATRYLVTRTLVRRVLGEILGVQPAAVSITQTDLGKPVVAGDLHFNVSHSGQLIVLAVSRDRAVGIDIERRRVVPRTDALAARWLTDAEREAVRAHVRDGLNESDAFLRVWSMKEARLKALGVGISGALSAAVAATHVASIDDLLGRLAGSEAEYVGAVAFA